MNWYSIFYWLTVADGVKSFLDTASNLFTWGAVISLVAYFIIIGIHASSVANKESESDILSADIWRRSLKGAFYTCLTFSLITWAGYAFIPTKKDALIIIAGGTVGNFVTQDTSARKLPSEVMLLLRTKIQEEIKETNLSKTVKDVVDEQKDTLQSKSKEELIQILKDKK